MSIIKKKSNVVKTKKITHTKGLRILEEAIQEQKGILANRKFTSYEEYRKAQVKLNYKIQQYYKNYRSAGGKKTLSAILNKSMRGA